MILPAYSCWHISCCSCSKIALVNFIGLGKSLIRSEQGGKKNSNVLYKRQFASFSKSLLINFEEILNTGKWHIPFITQT